MPQDLPPQGGYAPVQYKRNLPARGFSPGLLLAGVGVVMTYGWYRYGVGIRERNEYNREKMWARIYLTPVMQAEDDRDAVRKFWADQERERELLGEVTSPYFSKRFVRPTFVVTPEEKEIKGR